MAEEVKKAEMERQLIDITDCSICLETYTEPRILPCIHTFCLKCLQEAGAKTNRCPEDRMPCPICRKEFTIPENGFSGLQKNFFMDRLVEIRKVLNPPVDSTLCDLCSDDNDLEGAAEIPAAEVYCADCHQKLCQDCRSHHKKNKMSKLHKIIDLNDQMNRDVCIESSSPNLCDQHKENNLEIYCYVCQMVTCTMCFLEFHKAHDGIHVSKIVSEFREQIKRNTETFPKYVADLVDRRKMVEKDTATLIRKTEDIEIEINSRREELTELVVRHSEQLRLQLQSLKQGYIKESEFQKDDIEILLGSIESYETYCKQVITMGSPSEICGAVSYLNKRAQELKCMYYATEKIGIYVKDISLRKSGILESDEQNTIGEIEEKGLRTPVGEQSGLCESEAEFPRSITGDILQESDDDCNETEDSEEQTEEQPLEKVTDAEKQLMDRVSELEQQLKSMKKEEMERQRVAKRLQNYKPTQRQIDEINVKMATGSVTVTGLTILHNELFITTMNSNYIDVYDSSNYNFKRLLCVSELRDPWDMCSCPRNNCLYIANGCGYDATMRFRIELKITIAKTIVSCRTGKIMRFDKVGTLQRSWNIDSEYGTLSITDEGNVILTVSLSGKLIEYDTNGECVREINISTVHNLIRISLSALIFSKTSRERIICPRQSQKLATGKFLVNYFIYESSSDGVPQNSTYYDYTRKSGLCLTNGEGEMIHVFAGNDGSGFGELYQPWNLSVDEDMAVLVLDRSKRVSLLHPNLEYNRELLSKENGLSNPYKMCLDEATGRLLIASSNASNDHVIVFEVKKPRIIVNKCEVKVEME